ncbi:MAG: hypothetical protein E7333_07675 [Clostridiales bacterium]|nr:hypothetical protein [Clostridiales bacterium]
MKKRTIAMIVSLVLAMAMGLGGTLAYLTDRDSDVNVFTIGNVDIELTEKFEQGIELIPGVNIEKTPTIRNTGNHAAWVWMTWSIPAALDNAVQGTEIGSDKNIIHWNPLGATADGYVTADRVNTAVAKGLLPEGITADQIKENKMTWNVFNSLGEGKNFITEEIDGVDYNTYVLLYNKALTPGEETLPSVYNVYMDARVDIDPEGNMFLVDKGVVTPVAWNIKEDKNPKILVAAYAIQTEGFADVKEAYAGYATQWGANGGVTYEEPTIVGSETELSDALKTSGNLYLTSDVGEKDSVHEIGDGVAANINMNGNTLSGSLNNHGETTISGGDYVGQYINNFGDMTVSDMELESGTAGDYAVIGRAGSTTVLNDVNVNAKGGAIAAADGAKVIFNSGNIGMKTTSTSGRYLFYAVGAGTEITINGGTFDWDRTQNQKRAYIYAEAGTTVYVKGGTFGKASTRSGYTDGIMGPGTVIITGGTFGFDPTKWVAEGYQAVENEGVWTVSAK